MRSHTFAWIILVTILTAVPAAAQLSSQTDAANPDGVPADWFAGAQQYIRSSEYFLTWQATPLAGDEAPGYQAPNRAQDLRFGFGPDGLTVAPRTQTDSSWTMKLQPVGIGRGDDMVEPATALPEVEENRATFRRGPLVERFTNDEDGLHLVLDLIEPPDGRSDGRPARIALQIDGDLTLHRDGDAAVELRRAGEAVLRLGRIEAVDAAGQRLTLELAFPPARGAMDLLLGDDDAAYPITVTAGLKGLPDLYDWRYESDQAGAELGCSVATAGDINADGYSEIIIGAYDFDAGSGNVGKVFLFRGQHAGMTSSPMWERSSANGYEWFGHVVGTAGDLNGDGYADVFVGAPMYNSGSAPDTGRVYVYFGSLSGLPASGHSWADIGVAAGDRFGWSVSTAGDTDGNGYSDLVISAPYYDFGDVTDDDGKIYVYYGGSGGFGLTHWEKTLPYSGILDEIAFGWSVSTAGDVNGNGCDDIIVGSPYESSGGTANVGAARLYYGSAGGMMDDPLLLIWGPDVEDLSFGYSVATAGDVNGDGYADVIIGMIGYSGTITHSGGAAVYLGSSSGLSTACHWTAEGANALFGVSVATAGDVNGDGYADVIIGEPGHDGYTGVAWMWLGSSSGLGPDNGDEHNDDWAAIGGSGGGQFGRSVATAGDINGDGYSDVIIGAPDSTNGQAQEGQAYVYYGGPDNLAEDTKWNWGSASSGANMGQALATAGDLNGDGYADIVIGAPYFTSGASNEGGVFVWYGSAEGPTVFWPDWEVRGGQADAHLGWSVGTAGDVNGDGYADLVAGAPDWDNGAGQDDEGGVFVWHGASGNLPPATTVSGADWKAESNQAGARLGFSVGTAGDVNGDGYTEVVAGAPEYSNPQTSEGLVAVWHGSATGLGADGSPANADWQDETDADGGKLGWSVGTAGDVNGDGFSDLISGAADMAVAWHGSPSGLGSSISWWAVAESTGDLLGFSVGTAGDVNGDGYADVVVGAPYFTNPLFTMQGRANAYFGGQNGLGFSPSWWDFGAQDYAFLGYSVGTAGDLNGDGYADIVVGAPAYNDGDGYEGQVRVYYGGPSGPISVNGGDWSTIGMYMNTALGGAVATAGDVNGDAYADLLVGATGLSSDGSALLWAGNGRYGVSLRPRQMQPLGDPDPLSPLATTGDTLYVDVMVNAHCPTGRGTVWAYTELKELGEAFTGWSTGWYSLAHSTLVGTPIRTISYELVDDTIYHWRTRLVNSPVTSPFAPPKGRWIHQPWNGWSEADFRTGSGGSADGLIFADGFESGNTSAWN